MVMMMMMICTQVFKKTVNYYRQHGSHVFTCFIDFSKAFDSVDYWLLFSNLIESIDSISCFCATRLLATWLVGSPCVCVGKMYALAILVLKKVCDKEVYCQINE